MLMMRTYIHFDDFSFFDLFFRVFATSVAFNIQFYHIASSMIFRTDLQDACNLSYHMILALNSSQA